jgi:hypothetical protein
MAGQSRSLVILASGGLTRGSSQDTMPSRAVDGGLASSSGEIETVAESQDNER